MSDPNRRADDTWRSRMEERLDAAIDRLTAHVSGCESEAKHSREWRDAVDGKLDKLVAASNRATGAWWAITKVAAVGSALAAGAWTVWEKLHVVVLAVLLLGASSALAHEDDPVLRELRNPMTGYSCCNMTDCALTDDWDQRQGAYMVRLDGEWKAVPNEIVIKDRGPHPTGQAVICISPIGELLCFLPGATGV